MMNNELVAIDLDDQERELMCLALNEYAGTAKYAYQLLSPVFGQSTKNEWVQLINRLMDAIRNKQPLSALDWARAVFLTEISFASDLVGSGWDFGPSADDYWFKVLRSLQYKVRRYTRFTLLRDNASYPPVLPDSDG